MNMKTRTSILVGSSTILIAVLCAPTALGGLSLTSIPTVASDMSNEGRAITPDGKYVGGLSGTANGFFFDVANQYVTVPEAGSKAAIVTGIAYRTDTNQEPPVVQVVLDGNNAGWHGQYMTSDGGLSWGCKRRDNTDPNRHAWADYPPPAANSLAATTDSDVYYTVFRDSAKNNLYTCRGSGFWDSTTAPLVSFINKGLASDKGDVTGVAATGRIVGYRQATGGPRRNYVLDYPNSSATAWFVNGLSGTSEGQAFSISLDGNSIFGHSPLVEGETVMHGYKAVVTSEMNSVQSLSPLPNFSDTAGSTSLAVPYGCSADGRYAVGMNYRGKETAVLWDTSHPNPANWTVNDLYALAAANGVADIFLDLSRAYSVGVNADGDPVITGRGTDGASTRAFLMTVPRWIAAIGFPGHQAVNQGETVTFNLITNGTDSLTYQWYKNGVPMADGENVSGAATSSLTLRGVTCSGGDAGDYYVVVTNPSLPATVTGYAATLTIVCPPVISSIECSTSGDYTLTFSGPSGQSYQLLYSTDITVPLYAWATLTVGTFDTSPATYTDTAPADSQRFYAIVANSQ